MNSWFYIETEKGKDIDINVEIHIHAHAHTYFSPYFCPLRGLRTNEHTTCPDFGFQILY